MTLILIIFLLPFVVMLFAFSSYEGSKTTPPATGTTAAPRQDKGASDATSGSYVEVIIQAQKQKNEQMTRTAAGLVAEDKVEEAMGVINTRWQELTGLRVDILYDDNLTKTEKETLDDLFRKEQEGLTRILSQYEELYGY